MADALDVSLIELMQAKRNEIENISTEEAEKLLIDTIHLSKSKSTDKIIKCIGTIILCGFIIISVLLLLLLAYQGKIVLCSAGSMITGLISWGIPIWRISIARNSRTVIPVISSFVFAAVSLMLQFCDIANEVYTGDFIGLEDTIDVLIIVMLLFIVVTLILNIIMARLPKYEKKAQLHGILILNIALLLIMLFLLCMMTIIVWEVILFRHGIL